jgi:replicative DNA helicase Mcm
VVLVFDLSEVLIMTPSKDSTGGREADPTVNWIDTSTDSPLSTTDEQLHQWLKNHHQEEVEAFTERLPDATWIQLSASTIDESQGTDLYHDLIHNPRKIEDGVDGKFTGIKSLLERVTTSPVSSHDITIRWSDVHDQRLVGEYQATDTERLIAIEGQVDQATGVDPVVTTATFECQRCGTLSHINQNKTSETLIEPHECRGCERQGPFAFLKEHSELIDHQQFRLQTPPEHATGGVEHLTVSVMGDLAGEYTGSIGRKVVINGYLTTKDTGDWQRPYLLQARDIELADDTGINVEAHRDEIEELEAADDTISTLVDSKMLPGMYAPENSDLRMLKLAVLLQACSPPRLPGGERGDMHIFACGDPSTGKTDVAELAADIVPRSELVSTRVTGVGLTAAAVQTDLNGWSVKAGALARANGGLLAIDELDKIDEEYVKELHNPMESQQVSVTVADQNVTYPSETSVLATANPKYGRFDQYEPIAEQIDLPASLLSRFDLIITMTDTVNEAHDKHVADAVVGKFTEALSTEQSADEADPASETTELLQAWIIEAESYSPTLPSEQREQLKSFYPEIRQASNGDDDHSAIPVTTRQLEGVIRLATASARARHSDVIEDVDVDCAITLVKRSLQDVGVDPDTGNFDADLIETGTSKSQRDRVKRVESVVTELERENDEAPAVSDVIEEMVNDGFEKEKAGKAIDKALAEGHLYETQSDRVRVT